MNEKKNQRKRRRKRKKEKQKDATPPVIGVHVSDKLVTTDKVGNGR